MRNTNKKIVLLCSALVTLSGGATIIMNQNSNILSKEVVLLKEEMEYMNSSLQDLKKENENLQKQADDAEKKLNEVKKDVKEIKEWLPVTEDIQLASKNNSFKSYMDYKCITDKSSAQYKLIYSDEIKVCNDGLLRDDKGYVGVALGSYYADKVGDRFIVTFEDGSKAKFIVLDMKADKDTNGGANHKIDNSMIEFVIDTNMAQQTYPEAIRDGNFNSTNEYDGNIVKIEKVIKNY